MSLPRTMKELNFGSGLNSKGDERAQPEQLLDIATNVEFDDVDGLRCRFPFDGVRTALVGGGTLTDARKLAMLGSELVCFTKDALYAWVPAQNAWARRATHLAIALDEEDVFSSPADQYDADRAELAGVVFYAWVEGTGSAALVYLAAADKATGTTIFNRAAVGTAPCKKPRLVALETRVLLLYEQGSTPGLLVRSLDPAAISVSGGATSVDSGSWGVYALTYDAERIPNADTAVIAYMNSGAGTAYTVLTLTAGLVETAVQKTRYANSAIAVAVAPDGQHVRIFRTNGISPGGAPGVQSDLLTIGLADVIVGQAIGGPKSPPPTRVAAAYVDVLVSGQYRCYVFWDDFDSVTSNSVLTGYNWADDSGAIGFADPGHTLVGHVTPTSRAFAYDGHVYFWTAFDRASSFPGWTGANATTFFAQVQNTYFLYREDGFLCAKAAADVAGGVPTQGRLPNVATIDGKTFAWAGGRKRHIVLAASAQRGYSAERTPRDISFTFDSNEARRCVQLGETLYVTGGEILQYDGVGLYEVGFHIYPWVFAASDENVAGNIAPAGYAYKFNWRWANAKGEVERSTTATVATVTLARGGGDRTLVVAGALHLLCNTHKTTQPPACEGWRSAANPAAGAPFYAVTSNDPGATTAPNQYLSCAPPATLANAAAFEDNFADTTLTAGEANQENGAVLANLAPPAAKLIAANESRVFLGGISGAPRQIWYSKLRNDGEVAAFNDALTFDVPIDGGEVTALGFLDGALIVWCETATYAFSGTGFDNTGGGTNFQLSRILSTDLGCVSAESCALFDDGFLVKTSKGWFALGRSLSYQYVGAGVFKYDDEPVVAMSVLTARHQVRILTHVTTANALIGGGDPPPPIGRILVFDTLVQQWAETSVNDGLDMLLWNGMPAYLTDTGVRAELATWDGYDGSDYTLTEMDVETGWIKFGAMQSRAIVDAVQLLGEYRSDCRVRVRLARDYKEASGEWAYDTDKTWTPSPAVVGSSLQLKQGPRYRRCGSLKARFTITAPDGFSPLGGPCVRMTSIAMPYAVEPNTYSALAAAQKQ